MSIPIESEHDRSPADSRSNPLSPAEVESLLASSSPNSLAGPVSEIRPIDLSAIRSLHGTVTQPLAEQLSTRIRLPVELAVERVEQMRGEALLARWETPSCWFLVRDASLPSAWGISWPLTIAAPFLDRLLGGSAETNGSPHRQLTEIEVHLLSAMTDFWLRQLEAAWRPLRNLSLAVVDARQDPRGTEPALSRSTVVSVAFRLRFAAVDGLVTLVMPRESLPTLPSTSEEAPARAEPASHGPSLSEAGRRVEPSAGAPPRTSVESLATVVAILAESRIGREDLLSLSVGDVITTEQRVDQPLRVEVDGVLRFLGRPGAWHGFKAIQIQSPADAPDRAAEDLSVD